MHILKKVPNDLLILFKKWHGILRQHERDNAPDQAYWYTERTNVGHLALAAYKIGGYPLQEFSLIKGRGSKKSTGRADLFFYIPKFKNGVFIEAKQRWFSLGWQKSEIKTVRVALNEAMKDVNKIKDEDWPAGYRIGLVFVLPYRMSIRKGEDRKLIGLFDDKIRRIAKALDATFWDTHYAKVGISLKAYRKYKTGWYPGIAIIGKVVKTST